LFPANCNCSTGGDQYQKEEERCQRVQKKSKTKRQSPAVETPVICYEVGQFVAMCCKKYKECKPQIARIRKLNAGLGTIQIDWLDVDYKSDWKIWKIGGRIIKDIMPMRAILPKVQLSTDMCILKVLKCKLDKNYCNAEFV